MQVNELLKVFPSKISVINYITNLRAPKVVIQLPLEQPFYRSIPVSFSWSRLVQFSLQGLKKQTTELLSVLLDVGLTLTPAEGLDEEVRRDGFVGPAEVEE